MGGDRTYTIRIKNSAKNCPSSCHTKCCQGNICLACARVALLSAHTSQFWDTPPIITPSGANNVTPSANLDRKNRQKKEWAGRPPQVSLSDCVFTGLNSSRFLQRIWLALLGSLGLGSPNFHTLFLLSGKFL